MAGPRVRKVRAGELDVVKIGKMIVIKRAVVAYLRKQAAAKEAQAKVERDLARQARAS